MLSCVYTIFKIIMYYIPLHHNHTYNRIVLLNNFTSDYVGIARQMKPKAFDTVSDSERDAFSTALCFVNDLPTIAVTMVVAIRNKISIRLTLWHLFLIRSHWIKCDHWILFCINMYNLS